MVESTFKQIQKIWTLITFMLLTRELDMFYIYMYMYNDGFVWKVYLCFMAISFLSVLVVTYFQ